MSRMTRAIIFDFDGVIVESEQIKADAFQALFADAPDYLDEIGRYHRARAGISRYVKFRHICENILGRAYDADLEAKLVDRFAAFVEDRVVQAPLVAGAEEFVVQARRRYPLFIASGTPEVELLRILRRRSLLEHFVRARGSPSGKVAIIREICQEHGLRPDEVVFVGDGRSDREAADVTGATFVARLVAGMGLEDSRWRIRDLTELEAALAAIDAQRAGDGPG